jgi:uncharacterized protein YdaU (DUF1376 family)
VSLDWYPWYPIDYRRDTLRLTLAEDGAYRRLIDEYMIRRGPLPDDDVSLARILGIGMLDWLNVGEVVRRFFQARHGLLYHRRCEIEMRAQDMRKERRMAASRKANFVKALKYKGMTTDRSPNATDNTLHRFFSLTSSEQGAEEKEAAEKKGVATAELTRILKQKGWA